MREYNGHGRGALLVQYVGQPDEEAIFAPIEMLDGSLVGPYAMLAAEYDPLRDIVVILMRPPSAITAYAGSNPGRDSPPQAHQRLAAVLFGERRYRPHRRGRTSLAK